MNWRTASLPGVVAFALAPWLSGAALAADTARVTVPRACTDVWTLGGERPGAPPRVGGPSLEDVADEVQVGTRPDGTVDVVAAHVRRSVTRDVLLRRLEADREVFLGCESRPARDGGVGQVCETVAWGTCRYHAILQEWTLGHERHLVLFVYEGIPDRIESRDFRQDEEVIVIDPDETD